MTPDPTQEPPVGLDGATPPTQGRVANALAALRFDGLLWRKFARLGCVYGPDWWKRLSPPVVAAIIYALVRRNRRGAVENQGRVLGRRAAPVEAHLAAYRMFATFARCMTETMEFYGPRPRDVRIDEPPERPLDGVLSLGSGVILATAHIGNWDISARALHATGRPVNVVMAREMNATTQEYARRSREETGVKVIFSDSSVFSAFNMIRALRKGEIVAMQIDRAPAGPATPALSVRAVPFFGRLAVFQEGPFHLARLSGAPVMPVCTLRRGLRHYEILLGEPIYVSREVPGDVERALGDAVAFFEDRVRENPEQWFQFTPFWADAEDAVSRDARPAVLRRSSAP